MLKNGLTTILALTGLFGLAACGEDKDDEGTTNATLTATMTVGDDGSESDTGSASNSASNSNSGTESDGSATMTDSEASATMTDTDMTAGSESGGECPAGSECQTSADCDFGVMCVDCMCEGGDSSGGQPTSSDYGPCDMCAPGEMPVGIQDIDGCFCSPVCDGAGSMCPTPNEGTAQAVCALELMMGAGATQCALACDPAMMNMCPPGATCTEVMGGALCLHPVPM